MAAADAALYRSKRAGRDRVTLASVGEPVWPPGQARMAAPQSRCRRAGFRRVNPSPVVAARPGPRPPLRSHNDGAATGNLSGRRRPAVGLRASEREGRSG